MFRVVYLLIRNIFRQSECILLSNGIIKALVVEIESRPSDGELGLLFIYHVLVREEGVFLQILQIAVVIGPHKDMLVFIVEVIDLASIDGPYI
jgi:hypothetical protein